MQLIKVVLISILFSIILISGCISQENQNNINQTYSDQVFLSNIVFCKDRPDISNPSICNNFTETNIDSLVYIASGATNFSCKNGEWSGTCITNVTDNAGKNVLSGSSDASSVCSDRRMLCQVPIDGINMPSGNYKVTFTVIDNNQQNTMERTAEFIVK